VLLSQKYSRIALYGPSDWCIKGIGLVIDLSHNILARIYIS
jgi:hypothetical protein